jgi:CRISPR/Cas system type I-B associated protein Csh2 (Cas7 group RAMP superfamily)
MSEIINSRSELLFLYDIENANPNGDPRECFQPVPKGIQSPR